jgi:transcriptional regulator with XRE-family HTH domain
MKRLPDDILQGIGAEVRRRRRAAGHSLERLAALADLHKNHVSHIERGETDPSISALWSLATALECDIFDLFPSAKHGITPDVLTAARTLSGADPEVRVAIMAMLSPPGARLDGAEEQRQ